MPVEMMVMIGYLFWLYWWHHIYANVFDGNHANDSGNGDHDEYADDNEDAKLGGRWSTAKEKKDLKREK